MNKAELIDVLTEKLGSDRRQATAAVENVVDTIVRAVHKGDSVTITGFGVFEQRRRAAQEDREQIERDGGENDLLAENEAHARRHAVPGQRLAQMYWRSDGHEHHDDCKSDQQ